MTLRAKLAAIEAEFAYDGGARLLAVVECLGQHVGDLPDDIATMPIVRAAVAHLAAILSGRSAAIKQVIP